MVCSERCIANRANGEQCSRRKKPGENLCGTHMKGTPHGMQKIQNSNTKTSNVWSEKICGIQYFIDDNKNVYSTEDIMNRVEYPKIIAKWVINNGKYSIPDFNI